MTLEKATLIAIDSGVDNIELMFNPSEISFSRRMSIEQSPGARTDTGLNKTSFKHPNPYVLQISNIMLDTYELSSSVLEKVQPFTEAVKFTQQGSGSNNRPPIYLFTWGEINYFRCFVKHFECKLTLFLPDGTPVRAILNLTLEQVDPPTPSQSQGTPSPGTSTRQGSTSLFLS